MCIKILKLCSKKRKKRKAVAIIVEKIKAVAIIIGKDKKMQTLIN